MNRLERGGTRVQERFGEAAAADFIYPSQNVDSGYDSGEFSKKFGLRFLEIATKIANIAVFYDSLMNTFNGLSIKTPERSNFQIRYDAKDINQTDHAKSFPMSIRV